MRSGGEHEGARGRGRARNTAVEVRVAVEVRRGTVRAGARAVQEDEGGKKEEKEEETNIKSNNPHLTGGEKGVACSCELAGSQ